MEIQNILNYFKTFSLLALIVVLIVLGSFLVGYLKRQRISCTEAESQYNETHSPKITSHEESLERIIITSKRLKRSQKS